MTIYAAGIDIGSRSTECVVLADGQPLAQAMIATRADSEGSAREVFDQAVQRAGIPREEIESVVATGYGRVNVPFASRQLTEILCHGVGAGHLFPGTRTIIDIGGQDSKAIVLSPSNGETKVTDFVMNDKCAAGTGRFLEVMAGVLEIDVSEMGPLSLRSSERIDISSMCTVFAESEVISLIHERRAKEDIARGLVRSIAVKVLTIARKVGVEEEVTLTGGVALNSGLVAEMREILGLRVNVPEEPQYVGALGAALLAWRDARIGSAARAG